MKPKRLFDFLFSAVGLLLLSPIFLIVALMVKFDSRGPAFFVQRRMGRNFRPFKLLKFRTMIAEAEKEGPFVTVGGDPRITRAGRLLRKTKLDELPQLLNVLRGDMSLVGPRPEVEKYVELYRCDYEEILRVRPGITDIASLTYRNEEQVLERKDNPEEYYTRVLLPEKIRLAKEYGRKSSLFYDLRLIALTVFSLLYPKENIMTLIEKITPYRKPIVVGVQALIFAAANYLAFYLRFDGGELSSYYGLFLRYLPLLLLLRIMFLYVFSLDKGLWRYVSVKDLISIIAATSSSSVFFVVIVRYIMGDEAYPRSVYFMDWFITIFMLGGVRMLRRLHENETIQGASKKRIIVIGAGDAAEMLLRDIETSSLYPYEVIGLIDDNAAKRGLKIRSVPIRGTRKDLPSLVAQESPDEFLVAIPTATRDEFEEIVDDLRQYALPIKTVPSFWSILSGKDSLMSLKIIEPEDILFRAPTDQKTEALRRFFRGKRILITGAGGSIGSELSRQAASYGPSALILFERHEESLYKLDMALRNLYPSESFVLPVIGDILDQLRVDEVMKRFQPEIVLHAAAYKHVPLMEGNSYEAFRTNVIGTRALAEKCAECGVSLFVLISTDKAVNPANIMGMTKKIAENVIRSFSGNGTGAGGNGGHYAAPAYSGALPGDSSSPTRYITVRFGNVLESSGSVVPLFNEQIKKGGPVTVTHPEITRYFMTIPEAVTLVLQATTMGKGGEVFVLDMGSPVKILDLAKRMISLYGYRPGIDIDLSFVGLRPGEKLYEELFNSDEIVEKTAHPKINRAICRRPADCSVIESLDAFTLSADNAGVKDFIVRLAR